MNCSPRSRSRRVLSLATVVFSLAFLGSLHAADRAPAFRPLFNGKDLSGWVAPTPNPFWRVENGAIVGQNDEKLTGSMLSTESSHKNFIIEFEARWEAPMDSGLFVRKPALQMQIGVSVSQKRDLTGSFYIGKKGYVKEGAATDAPKYLKAGDWNTLRFEAKGDTFTVWINGHQVARYTDAAYPEAGPVSVQVHPKIGGKVEFKNIKIADLP